MARCSAPCPPLDGHSHLPPCPRVLTQVCKTSVAKDYKYCQGCSYQKGLCAMCGACGQTASVQAAAQPGPPCNLSCKLFPPCMMTDCCSTSFCASC